MYVWEETLFVLRGFRKTWELSRYAAAPPPALAHSPLMPPPQRLSDGASTCFLDLQIRGKSLLLCPEH